MRASSRVREAGGRGGWGRGGGGITTWAGVTAVHAWKTEGIFVQPSLVHVGRLDQEAMHETTVR